MNVYELESYLVSDLFYCGHKGCHCNSITNELKRLGIVDL